MPQEILRETQKMLVLTNSLIFQEPILEECYSISCRKYFKEHFWEKRLRQICTVKK